MRRAEFITSTVNFVEVTTLTNVFAEVIQKIQFDHRTDLDPIGFYFISVKSIIFYRHLIHEMTFGSLVLEV